MRRFFLLAAVAAAVLAPASAAGAQPITGSGWSWLLPSWMPHQTVDFVTPTEWWATGASGVLLHTTDGGATWDAALMPCDPWKFDFVDGEHGWAIAPAPVASTVEEDVRGMIWRTVDGGATWERTMFATTGGLSGIAFADPLHGCAISSRGVVLRTADGGVTWAQSLVPDSGLMTISMPDATHVWASGWRTVGYETTGAVYGSADGGASWTLQTTATDDVTSVTMATSQAGWCAARGHLLHTTNGGLTWDVVDPTPTEDRQWNLLATGGGGSHAWASGWSPYGDTRTVLLATSDGGQTWRPQTIGDGLETGSLSQLQAFSTTDLVACTGMSDVWTSTDGGETWSHAVQGMSQQWTQDLSFVSADEGWAATGYSDEGEIRHTTDGGLTWDGTHLPLEPGTDRSFDPSRVVFMDAEHGCAVGSGYANGALATTADGGDTWTSRTVPRPADYPYEVGLTGVDFAGLRNGWAIGYDGAVIRTIDGGATWKLKRGLDTRFSATWSGVAAVSASRCCLVGRSGKSNVIARTTDGGATWQLVKPAAARGRSLSSICFTDASHGWVTGSEGLVLRTSDGGASWQSAARLMCGGGGRIAFADAKRGWILGSGLLWRTTDGGATWRMRAVPCPSSECIAAPAANICYVGGEQGVVRTTTGGASATDSTPPVTRVSKPSGTWHNHPVKLKFTVDENGSGLATTIVEITGWSGFNALGTFTVDPGENDWDGLHNVRVASLDVAGNGGAPVTFKLGLDTKLPDTYALKNVTIANGGTARFPYKIKDAKPGCGSARTWLYVFNRNGKILKTVPWGARKANVNLTGSWRCSLAAGVYGWLVAAVDIAGNKTDKAYYSLLQVTGARGATPAAAGGEPVVPPQAEAGFTPPSLEAVAEVVR